MTRRYAKQRGVSLIEAVVALGVMAFGMLALVGVQATLRGNGDQARQRTEALRIAQETLETYRAYPALAGTSGEVDFSEITTVTRTALAPATGTALAGRLNTTFYATVTVPTLTHSAAMKPVAVTVDWTDRSNQYQAVELRSLIAGVPPELAGALAIPPSRDPFAAPRGRHRNVPLTAFSLPGTHLSVFKPPRPAGTVAWVFNDLTGLVTGLCTVDVSLTNETLTTSTAEACTNNSTATTAQLVRGYVRFAGGDPSANSNAEAETPSGNVLNLSIDFELSSTGHPSPETECYDDAPRTSADVAARTDSQVAYYCIVYSNSDGTFEGRTRIDPRRLDSTGSPWTIASSGATSFKVCRYTPSETSTRNIDHPLDYTTTGSAPFSGLTNQNFLVIGAAFTCPTEARTTGDLFNSNTALHQDGSSTYDNP